MNIYKTFRLGPINVTLSKSGISWSVGAKGVRYKRKGGRSQFSFRRWWLYVRKWF